jgi:alpha-tubulin suppressor-like RCC1 family protein
MRPVVSRPVWAVALALFTAGCFDPSFRDDLQCSAIERSCPPGYACGDDERCYREGAAPGDAAGGADALHLVDAAVDPDAALVPTAAEQVIAGGQHTCALLDMGTVRCWGRGLSGRLGYGNSEDVGAVDTPASAGDIDVGGVVIGLAAGASHTCALLESGAVRCWGSSGSGQLGYGNTENVGEVDTPASAGDVEVGGPVKQIVAAGLHTCALLESGAVRCWGSSGSGQLGYGNTETVGDDESPASAGDVDVGGPVKQLAAGGGHTCALLEAGTVRCWGGGGSGKLGYGNTENVGDADTPASAGDVDVGGIVKQLAAGTSHTCALLEAGTVRCWGSGGFGRLGYADTANVGDDATPADVGDVVVGVAVEQIAAGGNHTCALLEGGTVRCWGNGADGRLGYGNTDNVGDTNVPAAVGTVDVGGPVRAITTGGAHTCALLESGAVRCWGQGGNGRLGYGNTDNVGDVGTPREAGDVPLF